MNQILANTGKIAGGLLIAVFCSAMAFFMLEAARYTNLAEVGLYDKVRFAINVGAAFGFAAWGAAYSANNVDRLIAQRRKVR